MLQRMWRRLAVVAAAAVLPAGVLPAPPAAAADGLAVDQQVVTHQNTPASSITSPGLTTTGGNTLLLAFATSDGPSSGGSQSFGTVTGGGLTWTPRVRANGRAGATEIWQAVAPAALSGVTVTATRANGSYAGSLVVTAFTGADTAVNGAVASASAASGAPSVMITPTRTGSWIWGAGNDWDSATARTIGAGQSKVDEFLASVGDTFWVQRRAGADAVAGVVTGLDVTAPVGDQFNMAAIEIPPAGDAPPADTTPPTAPSGLSATAVSASRVDLAWLAATDDVGVAKYRIIRDGVQLGETTTTGYGDVTTAAATTYRYTVVAVDAAGNAGPATVPASVTTPSTGTCAYSPTTTAADCGYPTAATTGVPPGTSLTPVTGTPLRITEDGAVVEGIHLTGWLQIEADDVVVRDSVITSTSWWGILFGQTNPSATNLKVEHVTVNSVPGQGPDNGGYDYGIAAAGTGSMDVAYADVSGFKDGIDIPRGSVRDSYVHNLSQFTGAHTQAVYAWCGGTGLTLEHNTFVNQTDQQYSTAAIYIAPDCGHQNAVTVHDNWLAGGAYVLYGGDTTATNIRVTDNAFSTEIVSPSCGYFGTHAYWHPGNTGNVFSGNAYANGPAYGSAVNP